MSVTVHIITEYLNDEARIFKGRYGDGSTALILLDPETGEPLSKATVCMVDYGAKPTDERHVFIKDYAENAGMLKALQHAGVVGPIVRTLDADHATGGVHECRVLKLEEIDEYER